MTRLDPIPDGGDASNIDSEFHSILDAEKAEDIEFAEYDLECRKTEDVMVKHLIDDGFPLLPQVLATRAELGEESGLTMVYEHLVSRTDELRDQLALTTTPSEELTRDYQLTYLKSRLVIAIQQLAAAKGAQDSALDQVKKFEEDGDEEQANRWREFAHETRKEAEAQALTNESLGEKTAIRILSAVASEFEGESLLPLTEKSQEYLMMHRLKEEKSADDRLDLKSYTLMARELLESKLSDGQKMHPDFEKFAYSLTYALARNLVAPKYTQGCSPEQLQGYRAMISYHVGEAVKFAPQIGLPAEEVRTIYEDILSELS